MKSILYTLVLLLAMISCTKEDGEIHGTAKADDVIAGITVKLYTMETNLYKTTITDNNGEFWFTDLPSGNYYIGATITIGDEVWDTGNTPQVVYVSDEITKEVALSLKLKQ
ncbi:MAG: hypothetical protein GXO47_09160 [Chlorobi bacterium]|nr:hypothetical protein [Chlorobiota bacterium]